MADFKTIASGDIWQSRYNGEDFVKVEALSRSGLSARIAPCWRDGRRIPGMKVRTARVSSFKGKFRRYFSTEPHGVGHSEGGR